MEHVNSISEEQQDLRMFFLRTNMENMFPTSNVKVYAQSIIGEKNIYVRYINAPSPAECSNGIMENDPAFMRFCFGRKAGKVVIEAPCMHSSKLRNAGLKFRKITADNESLACEKLLAWFEKNREVILSVGTRN